MISNNIINLQKATEGDRDFYNQIYSNQQLMQFITTPLSLDESNRSFDIIIKKMTSKPPPLVLFLVRLISNNERIGIIVLRWNQKSTNAVEIGIIIISKYQKQGYAHLTKSLLINHTFNKLNVNTIIANCDKTNLAANHANKKLDFIYVKNFIDKKEKRKKIKWQITKENYI